MLASMLLYLSSTSLSAHRVCARVSPAPCFVSATCVLDDDGVVAASLSRRCANREDDEDLGDEAAEMSCSMGECARFGDDTLSFCILTTSRSDLSSVGRGGGGGGGEVDVFL